MSAWRQITRGFRGLLNPSAVERDADDEVQAYLDEATAAHRARGLTDAEARRAARVEIGGVTGVTEQVRSYGWETVVKAAMTDVRYAARRLRAEPGFTAITAITLALGIGATTAIFSAVNPVLFEPLPYPDAGRIASIQELTRDGEARDGTYGMYRGLSARSRAFETISVYKPWRPTMTGADRAERLEGQRVTAEYFRVLGVAPILGREFQPSEDHPRGRDVAIIADTLWRRRFNADPSLVGRDIRLDDTLYSVVGIMPRGFENVLSPTAEIWAPLQYDMSSRAAWGHHLRTVGRLGPHVSAEQATREVNTLGRAVLAEQHPETYGPNVQFAAISLRDDITRGVKTALVAIAAAVSLVLVIAAVNVTNLLLARGVHRRAEFALRAALGAGKGRLVRQLLAESLLLAAIGGVAGMAVAFAGLRALIALSPPGLPRVQAIAFDATVFAAAAAITTAIGLLCGAIPAIHAARSDPHAALQQGPGRTAGGHRRIRRALVVAEVALALVLLVSSGLLLRSLQHLFAVPSGFQPSGVLTLQIQTSGHRFDTPAIGHQFFNRALDAVRAVPGVTAAALTSQLPLSGEDDEYGAHFEGEQGGYNCFRYAVSPGYIEALGIPLRRGRAFDDRDRSDAPPVALISESFARGKFHGVDPIGQRLHIGPLSGPLYTIVGVVGDVRQMSLALDAPWAVYLPSQQWPQPDAAMSLVVRARGDAASYAPAIREALWAVDKDQPIVRVVTLEQLVEASAAERRFALILFEAFAIAALVLAAAGIYGVIAGSVAERTREIGVRAALGATRRNILALVLGEGVTLMAFGIAIGLAAAAAASRGLGALLFDVSRLDPATYVTVVALLVAVALIACSVPAWRATRVDPARTLRAE